MEKEKQRDGREIRATDAKSNQRKTRKPNTRKNRCHLHGVIRGGRFYLD